MAESSDIEIYRKYIVKNYVALKKYLHPDPIIDCEKGFELLTVTDRKNIQGKDPTDKNETILRKVISKGAKGYTEFKECLKKTWQTELLELIVCAENGQDTIEIESRLEETPEYIKHRGELQGYLIKFYRKRCSSIPLSPLLEEIETPLAGFYVMPDIVDVERKSQTCHEEERTPINSLKDMFSTGSEDQQEIYLPADAEDSREKNDELFPFVHRRKEAKV
ncbi:uncharacterized protein LOC132715714 [Ruditapes philippinarum]|uniref:uncharacterized protein LOC132715714 n=1 Tax=Ruditapes philippinarum TaxID=129788 RepID=UPI00295B5088|nr:uncharacterized protein LOC132715714 [Ruditapes philippinarum]